MAFPRVGPGGEIRAGRHALAPQEIAEDLDFREFALESLLDGHVPEPVTHTLTGHGRHALASGGSLARQVTKARGWRHWSSERLPMITAHEASYAEW